MGDGMPSLETMSVKIDLKKLYLKIIFSKRRFIRLHEIARELCVTPRTAGKILSTMTRLGYLEKWSHDLYLVKSLDEVR